MMLRLLSVLQVMKDFCSRLCLTQWSQLLWKPTGPHCCSTPPGKTSHPYTHTQRHRQVSLVKYVLGRDLSHSFTRLRRVQHWWGCGDGVPGHTLRPHENDQICRRRETCGEVSTFNQELPLGASRLNRIDRICIVRGFLKATHSHSTSYNFHQHAL